MMRFVVFLALALSTVPAWAEIVVQPAVPGKPGEPYVEGKMVRVTYGEGDKVGVIAKGDNELDQHNDGRGLLLFTGLGGKYTVIGFGAEGQFISRDVTIVGRTPPPGPPPPPPPGPGPGPTPDIQDTFGFGKLAYDEARKIGDTASAAVLGRVWYEAANQMFLSAADIPTAVKFIEVESNKRLGAAATRWHPWARAMEKRFSERKLDSILDHIRAMQEVSKALTAASK